MMTEKRMTLEEALTELNDYIDHEVLSLNGHMAMLKTSSL